PAEPGLAERLLRQEWRAGRLLLELRERQHLVRVARLEQRDRGAAGSLERRAAARLGPERRAVREPGGELLRQLPAVRDVQSARGSRRGGGGVPRVAWGLVEGG